MINVYERAVTEYKASENKSRAGASESDNQQHYDVAIIGGGIGGLMWAHHLITSARAKIVLFEKGHDLEHRAAPS